ncbi:hypothetical protein [Aquitalea sp. ASV15]|uniref:hypothetical protein n=1 Tax=Aquitalea sp. ASV15 TaxID=2795104 RepID=UPI0018EDCDB9|nr:hypothetical protein [Aquitalea sp. ASV15]
MKLNRALQKHILEKLREKYTDPEGVVLCDQDYSGFDNITEDLFANTAYLGEHGLLVYVDGDPADSGAWFVADLPVRITAKGLDFLEQDGGLSAILNTVTVKLHADTIRDLIEAKIMSSNLSKSEKKQFMDQLKEMPGEALKALTSKLVEKGIDAFPDVHTIMSLVDSFIS